MAGCSGGSSTADQHHRQLPHRRDQGAAGRTADRPHRQQPAPVHKCSPCMREADFATSEQHPDPRYGVSGILNWLNTSGTQPAPMLPPTPARRAVRASRKASSATTSPRTRPSPRRRRLPGRRDPDRHLRTRFPVRIDNVTDFNFAYWHSATFNNDGTKATFTDEWAGGTGARCRATDRLNWAANAIFDIVDRKLVFRSYYKMPAAADLAGELRRAQRHARAGARPRRDEPGLVPGRDLGVRLHLLGQPEGARLLRPRPNQRRRRSSRAACGPGYWYNGFVYGPGAPGRGTSARARSSAPT